jgi:hypothetical protein
MIEASSTTGCPPLHISRSAPWNSYGFELYHRPAGLAPYQFDSVIGIESGVMTLLPLVGPAPIVELLRLTNLAVATMFIHAFDFSRVAKGDYAPAWPPRASWT